MIRSLSGLPLRSRLLLSSSASLAPARSYADLYSSVKEHPEPIEGEIKGTIPPWLNGRLIRNGPGRLEVGDTKYKHLFDGLSLIHSFTINEGRVFYQSRFLRSDTYKQNMAANRIVVTEFGTAAHCDPCKSLFQRMTILFERLASPTGKATDNCVVSVLPIGKGLIASTEIDYVHQISPETLDSIHRIQLSKNVAVNSASAHSHQDRDGTIYNLGNSFNCGAMYNVIKILPPAPGEPLFANTSILSSIKANHMFEPGYYHSFGLTDNYIVFMEQSLKFNLLKFPMMVLRGRPYNSMLDWKPEENVRFYVVEKATGKVVKRHFTAPACLVFHFINTYEEDGHIVVDVCAFDDDGMIKIDMENLGPTTEHLKPVPRRYVLPLNDKTEGSSESLVTLKDTTASARKQADGSILCQPEDLCDIHFDLPQINYKDYNGRKYKYTYAIAVERSLIEPADLLKLDVTNGTIKRWSEGDCSPSEPVFISNPDAREEDDGLLLSAVIHTEREKPAFLLVLDAKTMTEVGRVEFKGVEMHKDFHGLFYRY